MADIPLIDYARLDPSPRDRLAAMVANQTTLDRVVTWGQGFNPPLRIARMLAQDEYSHDVVVPVEGLYLVYDAT